jgi:GGDEF domain-containing protein
MVAAQLASVTGGGHAYRVGGEEFAIVFPEKSVKEAAPHLESLRLAIEGSRFRVRGTPERRRVTRGSDRRSEKKQRVPRKAGHAQQNPLQTSAELSLTVSIGIAEPNARTRAVEEVIQAADQALYRAKRAGRNRIETAGSPRARDSRLKRSLA